MTNLCQVSSLCTLLVGLLAARGLPAEPLILADSSTVAELVSFDGEKFVFQSNGQPREVAVADLVTWGRYDEDPQAVQAVLADGSVLVGELLALDVQTLVLESRLWGRLRLPRETVRGLAFSLPMDHGERDQSVTRMLTATPNEELLLLRNGDELAGQVSLSPTAAGSTFDVGFTGRSSAVSVATAETRGVILGGKRTVPSLGVRPVVEFGFRDGSRIAVATVGTTADSQRVTFELAVGPRIAAASEQVWKRVCWIQPVGFRRVTYLSDLETIGFKHIPFLNGPRGWHADRNVLGGSLRIAGQRFSKGIGMMPAARLAFPHTGEEAMFHADLALDARAGSRGSVVFRVFLARKRPTGGTEWVDAYTSEIIRGGDAPLSIALNLEGVFGLALLVDFAERGDERDYANWLNARLVR